MVRRGGKGVPAPPIDPVSEVPGEDLGEEVPGEDLGEEVPDEDLLGEEVTRILDELDDIYDKGDEAVRTDIVGFLSAQLKGKRYVGTSAKSEAIGELVTQAEEVGEKGGNKDPQFEPSVIGWLLEKMNEKNRVPEATQELFELIGDKSNPNDTVLLSILDKIKQRHNFFVHKKEGPVKAVSGKDAQIKAIVDKLGANELLMVRKNLMEMLGKQTGTGKRKTRKSKKTRKIRKTRKYSRRR